MNLIQDLLNNPAKYRKWLVALAGFAATAVAQGVLTGTAAKYAAVLVALLASVGVRQLPNEPPKKKPAKRDAGQSTGMFVLAVLGVIFLVLVVLSWSGHPLR